MIRKLKERVLQNIPEPVESMLRALQGILSFDNPYKRIDKEQKKIIIMLSADYGNLGDIAITQAQRSFLLDCFPGRSIIEVPIGKTYQHLPALKKIIGVQDIITTTGGGFMGSLYYGAEKQRCYIIKKFPNNEIISFPQTIYFEKSAQGLRAENRMTRIYSSHSNLTLLARDSRSFSIMKRLFPKNSVLLTPDIALYLSSFRETEPETTMPVGLCLRDDKEVGESESKIKILEDFFINQNDSIVRFDTHIGDVVVDRSARGEELDRNWAKFKSCKVVVTDRLHGMIFCAITGTPCIALNNANGKVKDVYNSWVKKAGGVVFLESINSRNISAALKTLSVNPPGGTQVFSDDFDSMQKSLKEII